MNDSSIDIAALAERLSAGVVAIHPTHQPLPHRPHGHRRRALRHGATGSGFVHAEGHVLTNAHNLSGPEAHVVFADGRRAVGRAVGVDEDRDLAVVAVDTAAAPVLTLGDTEVHLGQQILALSAPTGASRVTSGRIAAVATRLRTRTGAPVGGVFEHTAPMPPGASGGPVVDADGTVVGINTNRLRGGLYQAIPAAGGLSAVVDDLASATVRPRPRLGVVVVPSERARRLRAAVGLAPREGVLVKDVRAEGPAAHAGIAAGDLIVAVDGTAVADADDLLLALAAVGVGGSAVLTIARGAEDDRQVTVQLTAADD